jgi:hypothetical protein
MGEQQMDTLRKQVLGNLMAKVRGNIVQEGIKILHSEIETYYKKCNVAPNYLQKESKDFQKMRDKLNFEAGIIISNHPGMFDAPAILDCLHRDDVLVMVSDGPIDMPEAIAETVQQMYEKYTVRAPQNFLELIPVLQRIDAHIKNGGLLLIFPEGTSGKFQAGLSHLLDRLDPENMVYAFHFEPKDMADIVSVAPSRLVGVASGMYLGDALNVNRATQKMEFRIDERYTTVADWQATYAGTAKRDDKTAALSNHYSDLFGLTL